MRALARYLCVFTCACERAPRVMCVAACSCVRAHTCASVCARACFELRAGACVHLYIRVHVREMFACVPRAFVRACARVSRGGLIEGVDRLLRVTFSL